VLSVHAYPFVQELTVLLPHGARMGTGFGPVVVSHEALSRERLRETEIASRASRLPSFPFCACAGAESSATACARERDPRRSQVGRAEAGLVTEKAADLPQRGPSRNRGFDMANGVVETGLPHVDGERRRRDWPRLPALEPRFASRFSPGSITGADDGLAMRSPRRATPPSPDLLGTTATPSISATRPSGE